MIFKSFQNTCGAFKNVSLLQSDVHTREKLARILHLQNFEVNNMTLERINKYWLEDIALVEKLTKVDQKHLIEQFNEIGTCVNVYKNPGVTIQKEYLCNVPGFCEVLLIVIYLYEIL